MERKRGNLHCATIAFMAVVLLIAALCIGNIWKVDKRIRENYALAADRDICYVQSDILKETSDYLTEQFRYYLLTGEQKYLDLYWKEIDENRNRERAAKKLQKMSLTQEEELLINRVIEESNLLILKETWAMRLLAESKGLQEEDMILPLQTVQLGSEEQAMQAWQKKKTAQEFMFGPEYGRSKEIINTSIRDFQTILQERNDAEGGISMKTMGDMLHQVQFYHILLVMIVLAQTAIVYGCFIWPFLKYERKLRNMDAAEDVMLQPCGSGEMKSFANTFNGIYSDLKRELKKLERCNLTDSLTGIANRQALDAYVQRLIQENKSAIGLLMMDVDDFKSFNDGFGHLIGDKVLIKMGECFGQAAAELGGIAGRMGGEEFIIVIPDPSVEQMERLAANIMDSTMNIDTRELGIPEGGVYITVSVGSTIWPNGRPGDIKSLIHQADMALYRAKNRGKNQHIMYSEEERMYARMERETRRQREVEAEMYQALELEEFVPFFQPKYDLNTGKICGAEALVRWDHKKKGYLFPDYFIPILEKDGFITKIDFAMFEQICCCIREWTDQGLPPVVVACNFSRLNFGKETLVAELKRITKKHGVSPSLIQVELTESGLMDKEVMQKTEEEFKALHEAGFTIAIDDFGTGYSSLGMLHELSVDVLKVDKSFLHRDLTLRANELLLQGIRYIAQVMNMDTVVEGVETQEQVKLLKKMGFCVVQGFYFSEPIKKEAFEQLIKNQG